MIEGKDREETIRLTAAHRGISEDEAEFIYAIEHGEITGDVIDVGYLDTTLWEFGGQYLSSDHPSGRLIKFPNEKVLDELGVAAQRPLQLVEVDGVDGGPDGPPQLILCDRVQAR